MKIFLIFLYSVASVMFLLFALLSAGIIPFSTGNSTSYRYTVGIERAGDKNKTQGGEKQQLRETDTERERKRDRQTDRQRGRERQTETETERGST